MSGYSCFRNSSSSAANRYHDGPGSSLCKESSPKRRLPKQICPCLKASSIRATKKSSTTRPQWIDAFKDEAMTLAERSDFDRRECELDARIDATSIMNIASPFSVLAHKWLTALGENA